MSDDYTPMKWWEWVILIGIFLAVLGQRACVVYS